MTSRFSVRLPDDLAIELEQYCASPGMSKNTVLCKALLDLPALAPYLREAQPAKAVSKAEDHVSVRAIKRGVRKSLSLG